MRTHRARLRLITAILLAALPLAHVAVHGGAYEDAAAWRLNVAWLALAAALVASAVIRHRSSQAGFALNNQQSEVTS